MPQVTFSFDLGSPYAYLAAERLPALLPEPVQPHVLGLADRGALHPGLVTTRVTDWSDAAAALAERDWVKLVVARD